MNAEKMGNLDQVGICVGLRLSGSGLGQVWARSTSTSVWVRSRSESTSVWVRSRSGLSLSIRLSGSGLGRSSSRSLSSRGYISILLMPKLKLMCFVMFSGALDS